MKKRSLTCAAFCFSVSFILVLLSIAGCEPTEEYQRTVNLTAPMSSGGLFEAHTHNGYITVKGVDAPDCNLTASITARAMTQEDAEKLAHSVEVRLVGAQDGLAVKIEKPSPLVNKYVNVSLDAIVTKKTSLKLSTHNGAVKVSDITGDLIADTHNGSIELKDLAGSIKATTHNGKVSAENIDGPAKLETHNGEITCSQVSGNIDLTSHNGCITCTRISGNAEIESHNGNIELGFSESAHKPLDVSVITHNGNIDFTAPPDYSAQVDVSTYHGSIDTDLPITVTGKLSKGKLTGTIGTGEGKLYLETYNGSIDIRKYQTGL